MNEMFDGGGGGDRLIESFHSTAVGVPTGELIDTGSIQQKVL